MPWDGPRSRSQGGWNSTDWSNLDPNRWFGNLEVAMGKYVSGQPVVYVRHIYKYYAAYKLHFEETEARRGG